MSPTKRNLTMKRGDTLTLDVTVKKGGAPYDISGATFWFTAKRAVTDDDTAAVIQVTPGTVEEGTGLAQIVIPAADTDDIVEFPSNVTLYYDIQMEETDGTVTTLQEGTLLVTPDVTRTTT